MPSGIAGRLLDLADRVRRLPPPDRRDPERFHIAKSALAAELRRVTISAFRVTAAQLKGFAMTPNKITYCSWEGDPTILAECSDGRGYGFEHRDGTWKSVNAADVFTKAAVIGESAFVNRWPGIGLPDFPQ
jgi:hypothetical protein